jgi:hypothetical protein
MYSVERAVQEEYCYCKNKYYFEPSSQAGQYGNCESCAQLEGLVCDGGLENGTFDHIMPTAQEGYYLTGNALASFCLKDNEDNSFCLGGRGSQVPCMKDCNCLEGHDGFLCQNCKSGWTRDSYTQRCKLCPDAEKIYLELGLIWANAICSCFFYHILTIMAIRAGQGTKSLHSVLIRLWQSWVLSMNVLRVFDFSKIKMFSWGLEAAQMASQSLTGGAATGSAENSTTNSSNATTDAAAAAQSAYSELIPFPNWFGGLSKLVFSIDGISVNLGTPTTTIECFTELLMGEENAQDMKYIAQAVYHMLFPIFVLLNMLVLDLILVYVLYPYLERAGILGKPGEPKALRAWLAGRIKPTLEESCVEQQTPEELHETTISLFNDVMAGFTLGEKQMKLIAQLPKDGLTSLSDYYTSDEQRRKAKECLLLFQMPRFLEECEYVLQDRNLHEIGLIPEMDTSGKEAYVCAEVRKAISICAKHASVEEFGGAFSTKGQLFSAVFKLGGPEAWRLQVALIYPMFERSAKEFHGFSKQLTMRVWDSLEEKLEVIATSTHLVHEEDDSDDEWAHSPHAGVHKIIRAMRDTKGSGASALGNLVSFIEKNLNKSPTTLCVAFQQARLEAYLSEVVPRSEGFEGATQAWELIMVCCKSVWYHPEEMKSTLAMGPGHICLNLAERAGTGAGGLLFLFLHRANIMHHLEIDLYMRSRQELEEEWQKLCAFAYDTSLPELKSLLSDNNPAALLEKVARTNAVKEPATAGGGLGTVATVGAVGGLGAAGVFEGGFGTGGIQIMGAFEALRMMSTETAITKDYPVFGIFRHPKHLKLRNFLGDARPLIYIGLYTMWYPTTKRLLLLVHCEAEIEVVDGRTLQYSRWMQQANFVCYEGTHLVITFFALIGLLVWSFGLLAYLSYEIMSHKKDMNKQDIMRRYSYFTTGYEVNRSYWDILVKKSDNLLTIVITYTSIAVDIKAKLLCYAALAGAYLIIHVQYQPFDDRKNLLTNRIEFMGLTVRFLIFAMFEVLMIFQLELWMAASFAAFVLVSSMYFLITIFTHICCEFLADLTNKGGEGVKVGEHVFDNLRAKQNKEEDKSCLAKMLVCFAVLAKCFSTCCVEPLMGLAMKFARAASSIWQSLESDALCLMPAGMATKRIQGRLAAGKNKNCCTRLKHEVAVRFFHQKDSDQREFIVNVIAGFFQHMLCHLEEERLEIGDGLLGRFLAVSAALKEANMNGEIPMGISAGDRAEIMKGRVHSAILHAHKYAMFDEDDEAQDTNGGITGILNHGEAQKMSEKNFKEVQRLRLTGEDLNECLMLLQRLDAGTVNDILHEAKKHLDQVKHEAAMEAARARQQSMSKHHPGGHEATATSALKNFVPDKSFALTNEMKTTATAHRHDDNALPDLAIAVEDGPEALQSSSIIDVNAPWKKRAMEAMGIYPSSSISRETTCPPGDEGVPHEYGAEGIGIVCTVCTA